MFGCDPAGLARFKMPADDFSGTSKVSGSVTINGMPLEAAQIVFVPEKLLNGLQSFRPLAYATTDSIENWLIVDSGFESNYLIQNLSR
jgi:hypothetical protein